LFFLFLQWLRLGLAPWELPVVRLLEGYGSMAVGA